MIPTFVYICQFDTPLIKKVSIKSQFLKKCLN